MVVSAEAGAAPAPGPAEKPRFRLFLPRPGQDALKLPTACGTRSTWPPDDRQDFRVPPGVDLRWAPRDGGGVPGRLALERRAEPCPLRTRDGDAATAGGVAVRRDRRLVPSGIIDSLLRLSGSGEAQRAPHR
ncbi:hypothetical protein GCM10025331_31570 [Actinoplanes utahensis]|uniref:Uncharacterized protein n=1 Tax=Actinoplanes utahensis TaxID=1869 RepID=A0A0A6UUW2_ACTUT|nr:hypothetical protein MB27_01075 [Actinoplanes utahensis]GIF30342.1 hypothetical protein Aut01nite_33280 [Actinoplanes utahensis]